MICKDSSMYNLDVGDLNHSVAPKFQLYRSILNRLPTPIHKEIALLLVERGEWEILEDEGGDGNAV